MKVLAWALAAAIALPAAGADERLAPMRELVDAKRTLANSKDPHALEGVAARSASLWVRSQASAALANHYALRQQWPAYRAHAAEASVCAQLRFALADGDAAQAREHAPQALISYASTRSANRLCQRTLAEAAAAGAADDGMIWRAVRERVADRKSRNARRLLPLLRNARASTAQLNRAIQRATATMKSKRADTSTRTKRELLGISALVAAHSRPAVAAEGWERLSADVEQEIREHVWVRIAREGALDHLPQALNWYSHAEPGAGGRLDLAWRARAALRAGAWNEVRLAIEAMVGEQRELSAWQYWHATALGELGFAGERTRTLRAIAREHDDYYGILAHEDLGISLPPGTAEPDPALAKRLAASDADVRLALALEADGKESMARKVWKFWMARSKPDAVLAASLAASDAGWLLGSINAADRAAPQANSLRMRFPVPHRELISSYSRRFDLQPPFVFGLIRQESRFNAAAHSRAGARGLMQVMPATARRVARKHKYTRYRLPRLTRPDTNVILGTTYLSDLTASLGEDPILIAAAYNAGPGRARRWARASRGIERVAMVESIPFTETRIYVKTLLANRVHYGRILRVDVAPLRVALAGSF